RAGINSYLEGFLREENMRFRPDAIRFVPKSSIRKRGETVLNQWNNVRKKLGNFWLETGIGEIKLERTCGIVGENGIGKTTFVKILAGVIAQDSGTVAKSIKVSYKPQYLESESDKLVSELLRDAVSKYGVSIINPLGVDELMLKRLNELSGGELQKVSIALCLSKEADLYLLDEPSAFLDVEQRLTVSKVIRDLMEQRSTSAFVVDHDLLFIDYLSDDLIVFEGKPAEHGSVTGPFAVPEGMNRFLTGLDITMRRDEESHRPRINKPDSQMDRKQKAENKRYY
ncbi:MAG TPA: ATP-binding cassette domain-containing protein, partial [Candidatus Nanoarchaeia archaeon]|nr:ATP-binding cassette domain-containing protein [Candidatus Nanoarchaeia archaeon]